jgi:UDP-N-acetylglucosamine 2-epimerase (non-hydrolysing)
VVVSDSGGVQEEAAWFGVPVVVLRRSTPRWEGVEAGIASLTGLDVDLAFTEVARLSAADEQARIAAVACPYGDGYTARRVARLLTDPDVVGRLRLQEPGAAYAAAVPC